MRKPNGYWTLETLAESAKPFDTVAAWSKASMGAYLAARRKGLLAQVTAHMLSHGESISRARTTWTKEACLRSAMGYSKRIDWERGDVPAYQAARKHGWYDACVVHMARAKKANGYWTRARCIAEAEKHPTITAWIAASASSYQAAHANPDWLAACTAGKGRLWEKKWDAAAILVDAKLYSTQREWSRQSVGAYQAALRLGLLADATAHMEKNPRWHGVAHIHRILKAYGLHYVTEKTFDECRDKRRLPFDFYIPELNLLIEHHGVQHRRGWQGRGAESIQRRDAIKRAYAQTRAIRYVEILEWETNEPEITEEMIISTIRSVRPDIALVKRALSNEEIRETTVRAAFDLQSLRKIAGAYGTRSAFKRGNEPAYNFACRHGLIEQVCGHMLSKREAQSAALSKWTKERVIASAMRFRTSREWAKGEGAAYNAALRFGWVEEASAHFPTRNRQ